MRQTDVRQTGMRSRWTTKTVTLCAKLTYLDWEIIRAVVLQG
ncbi:MAG: hypothetical protein AAF152_19495 [Cyanobacteria bacterium P01_A01_bin.114]